jgi:hypothetical protein
MTSIQSKKEKEEKEKKEQIRTKATLINLHVPPCWLHCEETKNTLDGIFWLL